MTTKIFRKTFYLLIICVLTCNYSCLKKQIPPGGRLVIEHPFSDYLLNNNSVKISLHQNDLPVEIGYSFTSSHPGLVFEMGIRLPDSGRVYTVSLWDGQTQALLIQKNVQINNPQGFSYVDLNTTNEFVPISANHTYVVSVFMIPFSADDASDAAGDNFYDVRRNDQANVFPITGHAITYQREYTKTSFTPAFPDNLSLEQDIVNGFCDVGFSYATQ